MTNKPEKACSRSRRTPYVIAKADSIHALETRVCSMMADGYVPHGQVSLVEHGDYVPYWMQTMIIPREGSKS